MPDNNIENTLERSAHTFHIPVMGTGFTIDTPLRVAKYGISSVMSIGDDILIEKMRKFHCDKNDLPYEEIHLHERDHRHMRITAYLNLIGALVKKQVKALQQEPFEEGSEITRYYEMLPDSPLKDKYLEMLTTYKPDVRLQMQNELRQLAVPGNLDVNIMTKIDSEMYHGREKLPAEYAVAQSSLRGFAESDLSSSIVLSAGMNRRLFNYMATFDDFFPDENNVLKKRITLKVSDFRSAAIQGKLLAKIGLWVSEYRIESGLNCGGHAFASKGYLMGPILEEFQKKKEELMETLRTGCNKALQAIGRTQINSSHEARITVQGGIGTADEDKYLRKYYEVDGTGWGTPFLLVPEIVNVDDAHLQKLMAATDEDAFLSNSSPLGVPFWNLRTTASEENRRKRIEKGKPGSPCPKGYLVSNTEFTEVPICHASRNYQKRKLKQLAESDMTDKARAGIEELVMAKSCICLDLAGAVLVKNGINPEASPAICCGPGIVNYSKIATLEEMVSHIYGRLSILNSSDRPNMFIKELRLYVDHLRQEIEENSQGLLNRTAKYFAEFRLNLQDGIEHYRLQADRIGREQRERFMHELEAMARELENILPDSSQIISVEGAA